MLLNYLKFIFLDVHDTKKELCGVRDVLYSKLIFFYLTGPLFGGLEFF